jgi:hypothetical protein
MDPNTIIITHKFNRFKYFYQINVTLRCWFSKISSLVIRQLL